ncbi:MAG: hypothetical protein JO314_07055, partial [Acidobacteria bacterium]|nr:hypothetical protein [Acidobacteriota bacterium]
PTNGKFAVTHIWVKDKDGAWKLFHSQVTPIVDAAPAKPDDKKPAANSNK